MKLDIQIIFHEKIITFKSVVISEKAFEKFSTDTIGPGKINNVNKD